MTDKGDLDPQVWVVIGLYPPLQPRAMQTFIVSAISRQSYDSYTFFVVDSYV